MLRKRRRVMAPACGVTEQGVTKGKVHFPFNQRGFTCGFLGVLLLIYKKCPLIKFCLILRLAGH